jgi:hypothetical protein
MTRWALTQMRDHAAAQGARLVIVLVAPPIEPDMVSQIFDEIRPTVDGLGVPVIDLRDTFRHRDLRKLQVEYAVDVHPNALGHQFIFDSLYGRIHHDPALSAALLGSSAKEPEPVAQAQ